MPIEDDDDRAELLDADDFGTSALVGGAAVEGIYARGYVEIAGVEGYRPILTVRSSDVLDVAHGWEVVIGADVFVVRGVQADGQGLTRLVLELDR